MSLLVRGLGKTPAPTPFTEDATQKGEDFRFPSPAASRLVRNQCGLQIYSGKQTGMLIWLGLAIDVSAIADAAENG